MIKFIAATPELYPQRATSGSLGWDIISPENYTLKPFEPLTIPLGIDVEFSQGVGGFLKARSSLAQQGVVVLGGVIDSDYRGELMGILVNVSSGKIVELEQGHRIMQFVPILVKDIEVQLVKELSDNSTERMDGKFGSTGK